MVWYSQNVFPFVMKGDGFFTYLPNNRYMQVDKHWVWTAGFRQYLIKQGGRMHDIEVVGPVMWYLSNGVKRKSQNTFRIAVFDVTPISDGYAESIGILENYYCPSTAKSFLKGVLEVVENLSNVIGVDFTVSLKHKRNYSVTHDRNYIQQVKNSLEKGVIELVPFDINVYDFLSECDIALVTPYSSPVYLASAVQVPSIYFDPTANIEPSFEGAPNIIFASGKDELMQKLLSFYQAV
jgi:polysaccharide biosynthesis PFTS motif protein